MSTREHARLQQIQDDIRRLAALGPLRQRALLGHRPRGLQRRRRRLGLPAARPGAQQGLSLGRGRHRRHLRPLPAPRLRPGLLERPRSDPEGAALRPDAAARATTARTSRSTTSTSTTRRRTRYMKFLYKYPQAEYPVRAAGRGEPAPRRRAAGVRAARHRHLRRRPLLRHLRRVRQGRRPRTSASASRRSTAARSRRRSTSCRTSGSATPGPGAEPPGREPAIRRGPAGDGCVSAGRRRLATSSRCRNLPFDYRLGPRYLYAAGGRHAAVHRQRDERGRASSARRATAAAVTSRTPSTATSSTAKTASTRRASAPRPRSTTRSTRPGRRVGRAAPAADDRTTLHDPLADVDAIVDQRRAEADEFYAAIHPPKATDDEKLVQRQALAGHALDQADLPLRRRPAGSTATTPTCRRRHRASTSATCTGGT